MTKKKHKVLDRIAVMNNGNVLQVGTPNEIYETPANSFVADFIGETNFIEGNITQVFDDYAIAYSPELGEFKVELDKPVKINDKVKLTLRPEKVKVDVMPPKNNDKFKVLEGIAYEVIYSGFQQIIY